MGFALSVTAAILLIGAILMIGMFYPTFSQSRAELSDARADWYELRLSEMNTHMEVHDSSGNTVSTLSRTGQYYLYNSGETTIDLDKMVLLENGVYTTKQLFPNGARWLYPADKVHLQHLNQFSTGTLKFVCANGATLTVNIT